MDMSYGTTTVNVTSFAAYTHYGKEQYYFHRQLIVPSIN